MSSGLRQVLQSHNISEKEYENIMKTITENKIKKIDDKVLTCAAIGIAAGIAIVQGILYQNISKLSKEELITAGYITLLTSIILERDHNAPEKIVTKIKDWLKQHVHQIAKNTEISEAIDISILVNSVSRFVQSIVSKFEENSEKGGENNE